ARPRRAFLFACRHTCRGDAASDYEGRRLIRHKAAQDKTCCSFGLAAASSSMRFKLLRRRLTISAPRMKVRSAMPWPVQWAAAAVVLGFCGAISLWAFEKGKALAGVDHGSGEE